MLAVCRGLLGSLPPGPPQPGYSRQFYAGKADLTTLRDGIAFDRAALSTSALGMAQSVQEGPGGAPGRSCDPSRGLSAGPWKMRGCTPGSVLSSLPSVGTVGVDAGQGRALLSHRAGWWSMDPREQKAPPGAVGRCRRPGQTRLHRTQRATWSGPAGNQGTVRFGLTLALRELWAGPSKGRAWPELKERLGLRTCCLGGTRDVWMGAGLHRGVERC